MINANEAKTLTDMHPTNFCPKALTIIENSIINSVKEGLYKAETIIDANDEVIDNIKNYLRENFYKVNGIQTYKGYKFIIEW